VHQILVSHVGAGSNTLPEELPVDG
jgi:hypothetical protein